MCKIDNQWETAIQHREPILAFCDDLEGWNERDREVQAEEDPYIYIYIYI